jgi:hypothetical protein
MSIEQKIADILAESNLEENVVTKNASAQEPSHIAGATDGETKVEDENEDNDRNNVGSQKVGGKDKASNVVNQGASAPESTHIAGVSDGVTKVEGQNPDNARNVNSMKEDIEALVSGEELTEEFKEKAATIFEAAVLSRVKQEVAKLDEAYEAQLSEQVESIKEGLVEKVDGYLDYVVEQWMEQNEIALERGMKSEILEGFVGGLKSLFEEHYIDIPEEKFDVLGALEEEVETLNGKLNEQLASNVELNKQLSEFQIEHVKTVVSEGLVDTDKEKFFALIEELEFDDVETFAKKAQTIRESYFTNKATTPVVESVVTDAPVSLTEEADTRKYVDPQMKGYLSVLDNLK